MKKYILGYKKAIVLSILAFVFSLAAYLSWPHIEAAAQYDDRMLWENIWKLIIGLCFMPAVTVAWLTYADKNLNRTEPETLSEMAPAGKGLKAYIPIIVTCIVLYTLLALLMYCSWLQGDECGFAWNPDKAELKNRLIAAFGTYLATVSRSGDFIMQVFPLPANRWPCYLITPIAVVLIPFFTARLMGKKAAWWATRAGVSFYIFAFFLILLSVHTVDAWRNYRCHAAVMNYLWPSCATLLFLSLYNPLNWQPLTRRKYLRIAVITGVFLLGFYSAWGTESGTVALFLILSIFYLRHILKRERVPATCTASTAGAMWGALLLLSSPSFKIRSTFAGETFGKWHLLSKAELSDIVHNLSWEKIIECNGGNIDSIVILKSIPLIERIHFLPYLAERFWLSCQIPAIIAAILLLIILCGHTEGSRKRTLITATLILTLAIVTSCSFLVGCIPTTMSFLPPSYIVAVLTCYLFLKLPQKAITTSVIAALMALGALVFFVPIGMEAWSLKKYEHEYVAQIRQQKAEGKKNVIITYQIPQGEKAPKNILKLIPGIDTLNASKRAIAKINEVDSVLFVPAQNDVPSATTPEEKKQ